MDDLPMTVRPSSARERFDTVRYLRPIQIAYLIKRRLVDRILSPGIPRTPRVAPALKLQPLARAPFLLYPPAQQFNPESGRLVLLSLEASHIPPIAWERDDLPPLWVLELQYFHWLRPEIEPRQGLAFLVDWVQHNPERLGTAAWNPFGVAMRVLQWTRLLAAWAPSLFKHPQFETVIVSLYRQGRFLAGHQEFELLGNHLLKTASGLYAAGRFFDGAEAREWERRSAAIIMTAAESQTLPDGGHFERSPMYHLLFLLDLLDVLNMTTKNSDWRQKLEGVVRNQVKVARELMDPLGQIPLTNDSVLEQAPEPTAILSYAESVLGQPGGGYGQISRAKWVPTASDKSHALPDFGLYRLVAGDWFCWVDGGVPGPDYLLAHAHSDLGSILAWIKGKPLLVEAGACVYDGNSARRNYDRNAYGHNVLVLDGHGVCHCWREFRVGRRVRHVYTRMENEQARLAIKHDGFKFLPGAPTHERRVDLNPAELRIVDVLRFRRPRRAVVELLWHLDPAVQVDDEEACIRLTVGDRRLTVDWRGPGRIRVEQLPMARRFHCSETSPVLIVRAEIENDTEFETRFQLHGNASSEFVPFSSSSGKP